MWVNSVEPEWLTTAQGLSSWFVWKFLQQGMNLKVCTALKSKPNRKSLLLAITVPSIISTGSHSRVLASYHSSFLTDLEWRRWWSCPTASKRLWWCSQVGLAISVLGHQAAGQAATQQQLSRYRSAGALQIWGQLLEILTASLLVTSHIHC